MGRDEFRNMVKAGELTSEQAGKIMLGVLTEMLHKMEVGRIPNLTHTLRTAAEAKLGIHPRKIEARLEEELASAGGLGYVESSPGNEQGVIYWPDIIKVGLSLPTSLQTRLMWVMQAVLRRRSPMLFSLLRRKLLTEMFSININTGLFEDPDLAEVTPINPAELALTQQWAAQLGNSGELGDMLRVAFRAMANFANVTRTDPLKVSPLWKRALTSDSRIPLNMTVMSYRMMARFRKELMNGVLVTLPDTHNSKVLFGARTWGQDMYDVLSIPHLTQPDGGLGVFSVRLTGANITHFAVYLPLYIQQMAREDKYTWVGRQYRIAVPQFGDKAYEAVRDKMTLRWMAKYPALVENKAKGQVKYREVWPEADSGDVYVIPAEVFVDYRESARKLEYVRESRVEKGQKKFVDRMAISAEVVQMISPPIEAAGGETFTMRVAHKAGEIYFCPCWEHTFEDSFLFDRNYTRDGEVAVLLDGIRHMRGSNEYYYTVGRYLTFGVTPMKMYPQLLRWFNDIFLNMSKWQFKHLYRTVRASPEYNALAPRNPLNKSYASSRPFTPEEDRIIKRLLRPSSLASTMVEILAIDPARSRSEVVKQCRYLREAMVADGEYDIDKLPHINYSAKLGKRLKELKERKAREAAEQASQDPDTRDGY